jgi:hypothetical protein
VRVADGVHVAEGVGDGVLVAVTVAAIVSVLVGERVRVACGVRVTEGVGGCVLVGVAVDVKISVGERVGEAVEVRVAVRVWVAVAFAVGVRVGVGRAYVMSSSGWLLPWLLSKSRSHSTLLASGPRTDTPRLVVVPLIHSCARLVTVQVRQPAVLLRPVLTRTAPTAGWLFHVSPPAVQAPFT